jgi:anaerobic magnesium-protoporphyrin IX monomethyl ester cyclase
MTDILFINPNSSRAIYQGLSNKLSAIETPTWSLLLAESCRSKGGKVALIDCLAENLSLEEAYKRIIKINPKLICFVVYGQNVNAGTTNMVGAVELSNYIKKRSAIVISYLGSYVQALPKKTLQDEKSIDFVFINEGVYALHQILKIKKFDTINLRKISGIFFRNDKKEIEFTRPIGVVPNEKMDEDLPGYAWDLLPYKNKPLDLYRSPLWHAEYKNDFRSPYAAIQTSLGCQFKCNFCMINILNKNDDAEIGVASNYSGMRFWSTNFIIKEFDKLISMGVKTIKITDEMFLLNPKYYVPLCEQLALRNKNDDLMMWAYSRIDTVKRPEILEKVRKAGIKWLCLGIESGSKSIRLEVSKGKFEDVDVEKIVKQIEEADIQVLANYIYGLPGDTIQSIQNTFNLSLKLNTLGWNTYAAMALPGSQLYKDALDKKIDLPTKYSEFSFHSYDTKPLPTETLKPREILKLRDDHFHIYFSNKKFLSKIKSKFGQDAVDNINVMLKVRLKRKLIEENL